MVDVQAQVHTEQVAIVSTANIKAADYRTIYANQLQIALTPFDFQLTLSQVSVTGGTATNELQATVFLAPVQAKALATLLNRLVGDHERQFGTIHALSQSPTPSAEAKK